MSATPFKNQKTLMGQNMPHFCFILLAERAALFSSIGPQRTSVIDFFAECSAVKLDDKQRLNKEQSGVKEFLPSWEMLKFGFRGHSTTTWTQCPRTDLSKRFLPRPKTITE